MSEKPLSASQEISRGLLGNKYRLEVFRIVSGFATEYHPRNFSVKEIVRASAEGETFVEDAVARREVNVLSEARLVAPVNETVWPLNKIILTPIQSHLVGAIELCNST